MCTRRILHLFSKVRFTICHSFGDRKRLVLEKRAWCIGVGSAASLVCAPTGWTTGAEPVSFTEPPSASDLEHTRALSQTTLPPPIIKNVHNYTGFGKFRAAFLSCTWNCDIHISYITGACLAVPLGLCSNFIRIWNSQIS